MNTTGSWFLHGLGWLLSAVVGSLITYGFTRWRDEKLEKNKLIGACYSVCFYLGLQQSELKNLKLNIRDRLNKLNEIETHKNGNNLSNVTQDFDLCEKLSINIEDMSEIILSAGKDKRGIVEILQDVFISNQKYFSSIVKLGKYNEMKRSLPHDESFIPNIIDFLKTNFPEYQKILQQAIDYSEKTFSSFKNEVEIKLDITVNIGLGETVKLS